MGLNWNDSQELGELLFEKYDSVNPMTVRFADLRKWVLGPGGFCRQAFREQRGAFGGYPKSLARRVEAGIRG